VGHGGAQERAFAHPTLVRAPQAAQNRQFRKFDIEIEIWI
jgi:hypothetical protein